jgi:hypothetical protein
MAKISYRLIHFFRTCQMTESAHAKLDVLIVGVETKLGQNILSILTQNVPSLKIGAPAQKYGGNLVLPRYLVRGDFSSTTNYQDIFNYATVIVGCLPGYHWSDHHFIDAKMDPEQVVVEYVIRKLGFVPDSLECRQELWGIGFRNFLRICAETENWKRPTFSGTEWNIECKDTLLDRRCPCKYFLTIRNRVLAFFVWLFGLLIKLLCDCYAHSDGSDNKSKWTFKGSASKNVFKKFDFEVFAGEIDSEKLRAALAAIMVTESLRMRDGLPASWLEFNNVRWLKVEFQEPKK